MALEEVETEFFIDRVTKDILLGRRVESLSTAIINQVKERIISIAFDCTPNWGISGIGNITQSSKENWYLYNGELCNVYEERCLSLNINNIKCVIRQVVLDNLGNDAIVEGFGLYGSYFYGYEGISPEDIDILILVSNITGVSLDALRYRINDISKLFLNSSRLPTSNEIGLSIVSEEQFNPYNDSYIMTDVSLLDKATTFSVGKGVMAPVIPEFVLIKNAQKILYWGVSSLLSKSISLGSRIREAIYMRNYLIHRSLNRFALKTYGFSDFFEGGVDSIKSKTDFDMLCIAKQLIGILHEDERKIRVHISNTINNGN